MGIVITIADGQDGDIMYEHRDIAQDIAELLRKRGYVTTLNEDCCNTIDVHASRSP